jgi:hypothetical protein
VFWATQDRPEPDLAGVVTTPLELPLVNFEPVQTVLEGCGEGLAGQHVAF